MIIIVRIPSLMDAMKMKEMTMTMIIRCILLMIKMQGAKLHTVTIIFLRLPVCFEVN